MTTTNMLPIESVRNLQIDTKSPSRGEIRRLHLALDRLGLAIHPDERKDGAIGASTRVGLREVQKQAGLPVSGRLTKDTVGALRAQVEHRWYVDSKTRVRRLQADLQRAGHDIPPAEAASVTFGKATERAIRNLQRSAKAPVTGLVDESVIAQAESAALTSRLKVKTQRAQLHRTIIRAVRVAGLPQQIDMAELRSRDLGPTTIEALRAFQTKYGLPVTGRVDPATMAKLTSVATSRPRVPRELRVKAPEDLSVVKRTLSLNQRHQQVTVLQRALAFLGYTVALSEHSSATFGKTTREAVLGFQRQHDLPLTGSCDVATMRAVNAQVTEQNAAAPSGYAYRVRGRVRDEGWSGISGVKVQVFEKVLRGAGTLLGERTTFGNGFFDVPYTPPVDPATKQPKKPFHLEIVYTHPDGSTLTTKQVFNPTLISWANHTAGNLPYRGDSLFDVHAAAILAKSQGLAIDQLQETEQQADITHVALATGLSQDDVMRVVLSHLAAQRLGDNGVGPGVFFGYVRQSLPPSLPGNPLASTNEWTLIDQLVEQTVTGLVLMEPAAQASAFDAAVTANLMPIDVVRVKDAVLAALGTHRSQFTLDKPILVGNGTLGSLLSVATAVPANAHTIVAESFLSHRGLTREFWSAVETNKVSYGGEAGVADLKMTLDVGHVAKNHIPTVQFLRSKIADPADTQLKQASDLAKLQQSDWASLINSNGNQVPNGTDGNTAAEKVATFAATLAASAQRLFPTVALAAEVARSAAVQLPALPAAQTFIDEHDLELRHVNVAKFITDKAPDTPPDVTTTLRVLQRVNRLAPSAIAGRALLEAGLHSSAQIVAGGLSSLLDKLGRGTTIVDPNVVKVIHAVAEQQYSQVLQRITEYRFELHAIDPSAIVQFTYTPAEQQQLAGNVPDLETLFGSLDYCDCSGCESVYSPAAYLTDLLRFLGNQTSGTAGVSIADVIGQRRPDIPKILLNCANTETPVPYIDLVCEILENQMPPADATVVVDRQTTLTAQELRAYPEHLRTEAYDTLRTADFPIGSAFDLYQEEARVFLNYLGVSRDRLIEAIQRTAAVASDADIAAEYFGISSHERTLITTAAATAAAQTGYWGFDATQASMPVSAFLAHAHIGYDDLLALLECAWVNPTGGTRVHIERPLDTCSLDEQNIVNLSPSFFDAAHRFLRLHAHVPWVIWELDLLLRSAGIGAGQLDDAALVALRALQQISGRLKLRAEQAAALFTAINTDDRPDPTGARPDAIALYKTLFQNRAVTDPVDPDLALPLDNTKSLSDHRSTLAAALALSEADLPMLLPLTDGHLTLDNLSLLYRYATLARSLAMRVSDLLTALTLTGGVVGTAFSSPVALRSFLAEIDRVAAAGFTGPELAYVLEAGESPYGLRDEVVAQYVASLRDSLRTQTADTPAGQIAAQVAATFGLSASASMSVLTHVQLTGQALLAILSDANLTARHVDGTYVTDITAANFTAMFTAYRLLHKISLLVRRLRIDDTTVEWLSAHAASIGAVDFAALPVDANPAATIYPGFRALARWLKFQRSHPQPGTISLPDVVAAALTAGAVVGDVRTAMAALTTWSTDDLTLLDAGTVAHYADPAFLEAWDEQFELLHRLGIRADMAVRWADRSDSSAAAQLTVAREVRQTAKSKHDPDAWLILMAPLEDVLREKKRDALVAYLVEQSVRTQSRTVAVAGVDYPNPVYWQQPDDMLRYFLVDVETQACALTSRIKQAIGSVQLFAQRCLMNLEKPYVVITAAGAAQDSTLDNWRQWPWMQSLTLWQANKQVFLYPENWLDPTLRDDKTPFFVELEQEAMQGEITSERCEAAFLNYLHKLREVARLKVVGVYHEVDENDTAGLGAATNVLHVIGRTRSEPGSYYYRSFDLNQNRWSAWEHIDLDIVGDHVIPVVYNRKLHIFWLQFEEKTPKVKKQPPARATTAPTDAPEPPTMLMIQLVWTSRKATGWAAKRVGPHKLVHPWQRPISSYNVKPRYKSRENQLWLDLYISTSLEFNNTRFYDPYADTRAFVTAFRADETARPWHASSFVFDGDVVAVKMKPLRGQYHVLDANGIGTPSAVPTTSYQYVHDNFGADAKATEPMTGPYEIAPRLVLPDGMHFEYTRLRNNSLRPNPSRLNVLQGTSTTPLLQAAQNPFELVYSQHDIQFDAGASDQGPMFYQDQRRAFFIAPQWRSVVQGYSGGTVQQQIFNVWPFDHPFSELLIRELNRSGVAGLLNRQLQTAPMSYYPGDNFNFTATYQPTASVVVQPTAQTDALDFTASGAYATYNWEVFFHAPLLIANKLHQNQRFDEAMRWYHYVFDPTNTTDPDIPRRYWTTKPFYDQTSDDYRRQRIEDLLNNIGGNLDEVRAWRNNPYDPDLIARMRPVAYQKSVVMRYIDNLIAWGDQLFTTDTIESINQATLRYILAAQILGERPQRVPAVKRADQSFEQLEATGTLDAFGNARVDILMENYTTQPVLVINPPEPAPPLPTMDVLYFGIPHNDKLLRYWDTVADRLFKIRNCMNIEGAVQQLPLFDPPIDPALLIQARAMGVDLGSILSDLAAPLAVYRFRVMLAKAIELAQETHALGDRLLAVLERKDAEAMATLLAANEIRLQTSLRDIRQMQIDEAQHSWSALEKAVDVVDQRIEYYGSIPRMNAWEIAGTVAHAIGIVSDIVATVLHTVAGAAELVPTFTAGAAGFGGSPLVTVSYGGGNAGGSASSFAGLFQGIAGIAHAGGQMLETQGRYTREDEANHFQHDAATLEKKQLAEQVEAARFRYLIAQQELTNLEDRIEDTKAVADYLQTKYTNQQLYDWMISQVSTLYFQNYQLAFQTAKRAERCLQFELGTTDTFVQFGYWDSLKKGLLSGERLLGDLRRLESAYLQRNSRRFELSKNVSLAQFFPLSLIALKITGSCTIALPEWLFDLDHAGHYQRRIKSFGLSVPAVTGPYTNVNANVTMTRNAVRMSDDVAAGYGDLLNDADARFVTNPVPVSSIATSRGINDRGMFELRFEDDRYLPFEGAGAVCELTLELPPGQNQFDLSTVSDVILHLDYTAIAGSVALAGAANDNLTTALPTSGTRLFVLDQEFSTAWYRMLHPDAGNDQTLQFTITPDHLPFWARRLGAANLRPSRVDLVLDAAGGAPYHLEVQLPGQANAVNEDAGAELAFGNLPHMLVAAFPGGTATVVGDWSIKMRRDDAHDFQSLQPSDVARAYLVVTFSAP